MLDLARLLRVPYVDPYRGFDIDPGGTHAAFAWNRSGQWEIYEVALDGGSPPRRITGGPGGKFGPKYSPDGGRLAYALDPDGGESFHLCIYDRAREMHRDLTPDIPYALQPAIEWLPGGQELAFASAQSGCFSAYRMPAAGGEAALVLDTGTPVWQALPSPDGQWAAVVAEAEGQDTAVFLVPLAGGVARRIGDAHGRLNARQVCWAPDGTRFAFACDAAGEYNVCICEVEDGSVRWITQGEGDKEYPAWSPDGRLLAYVLSRVPVSWLAVQAPGGAPALHRVAPGVHYLPHFTPDGNRVVFLFDNPCRPTDLWVLDLATGATRQLTQSLPDGLAGASFAMPEEICYPGLDGNEVPALLYRPPGATGPTPAVVDIHGGPDWLAQITWRPCAAHMAGRGWTVLLPNYRGSTGFGRAWQIANRFDLGGCDTRDVAAGALFLTRAGLADPARIAVTGRSHGGYLTMTCLTQFPELWAAGSAVVPFLNWFTSHANARRDIQHWDLENLGDPVTNHDLWHSRSPIFFMDRVRAPVQLICGANDPRCPAGESLAARDALAAMGKPVELVMYADEGHGFLKTENVVDAEIRRMAFLARNLEEPT